MKNKIIGQKVKLIREIRTTTKKFRVGLVMKVIGRSPNGTYMLARPYARLDGPSAMFGEIHGVNRRDFYRALERAGK